MSEVVTLELSDTLARQVREVAQRTQRRVEDVLLEWLDRMATDLPVEQLSDAQVLALRNLQMSESNQGELSELLAHQREGSLPPAERVRLDALLALYRQDMVRKAQALAVAVQRGLQPPLGS